MSILETANNCVKGFFKGLGCTPKKHCNREDRSQRDNITEKEYDKMLNDSFPASDPPGNY